jgi:hypothetical protein
MSIVTFFPIEVGSTRATDRTNPAHLDDIANIDLLFTSYLTDVFLLPNRLQFVVDAFPFLYGTISRIFCLQTMTSFVLEIGEGLEVRGQREGRGEAMFDIKVTNCGSTEHEISMTTSHLMVALIEAASSLVKSISSSGIDVSKALDKFPPALF